MDYKRLPNRCAKFRMPKTRMIPYSSAKQLTALIAKKKHIGYARDRCMSDFIIIQWKIPPHERKLILEGVLS